MSTDSRAAGPGTRPSLAVSVWAASLLVIGSLSLASAWSAWLPPLALCAAVVVPLAITQLALRAGVSPWAGAGVVVLLLLLLAYLLASQAQTSFADTVRDAVPRLLTTPRPYPVRPDLLVAPVTLTGLVSVLVALRLPSPHRVAPVLGAFVLYVAGALLTSGSGDRWGLVAALLLVAAVLGWVLLDPHREPTSHRIAVVAPLAVAGVGIVVAATLMPLGTPFQPRDVVDPPVVTVVASSPMPQLGAWQARPDMELFEVTGPAVPLRLVTLDGYDGTHWTAPTRFAPLDSAAADSGEGADGEADADGALPRGVRTRTASLRIHLTALGGNWLPTPGSPTAISAERAVVDRQTGTAFLATDESVDPALGTDSADAASSRTDDFTYDVTGLSDEPSGEDLDNATVPAPEMVARYLSLPPLTKRLSTFADQAVAGAVTPYERAVALEDLVRVQAKLSPEAISGSQLWRIESFLLGEPGEPGARVGTSEQFATAYALLARYNGLPTRVVVGFRPGAEQPDGSRLVRGGDAFAWPEVYFEGLGWVPFSPTPDDDTFRRGTPQEARALDEHSADEVDPVAPTPIPATDADTAEAAGTDGAGPVLSQAPVLAAALSAVALAALCVLALMRFVRRRRHLSRGAMGAWAEVLDALHLSGASAPRHWSASQVAASLDARLSMSAAESIARRAELAAFSPEPAGAVIETEPVPLAEDVRTVRRAVRRTVPLWRRWWWSLDPRVLARR